MISFVLNGSPVSVPDDGASLLDVLRDDFGIRSAKDGCSPQGQCGCCTVWVDGAPRVACVTPARRIAGREITTLEALGPVTRDRWADAFVDTGASQCGFCTPGIVMRLAGMEQRGDELSPARVCSALAAHVCRCTGWHTIVEAAQLATARRTSPGGPASSGRDLDGAARRARIEGRTVQQVGRAAVLGLGGFADDTAPAGALVAVPDPSGGWVVAETLRRARLRAAKVQGRNSTVGHVHAVALPPGDFVLSLRTTFVEPAYLEPDASWCEPGGEPVSPLANGGAFGGKLSSEVGAVARRLADEHGRAVRVVLSREDVVRHGPKRPPMAAGVRADGSGVIRLGRTPGSPPLAAWHEAARLAWPEVEVVEVDIGGPPVSADIRAAGWAEATVVRAAYEAIRTGAAGPGLPVEVTTLEGARAKAVVDDEGAVSVSVRAGKMLDAVTLRSYALGAVHQALGWVLREAVAVGPDGEVLDLTMRSFGIIPARDMPAVEVVVEDADGPPVCASDAVFAAVAAAQWLASGLAPKWPVQGGGSP